MDPIKPTVASALPAVAGAVQSSGGVRSSARSWFSTGSRSCRLGRRRSGGAGSALLRAGSVVSRTQLVEDLWGESPPPTAAKAVNVYVSQLRKTLARNGGDAIETRMPGIRARCRAGLGRRGPVPAACRAARERAAAGELEAAATLMREALALWRGPALMGIDLEGAGPRRCRPPGGAAAGGGARLDRLRARARPAHAARRGAGAARRAVPAR